MNLMPPFSAWPLFMVGIAFTIMPLAGYGVYCTPDTDCSDGDQVENFTFNTISNLNSGGSNCNTNSYINTGLTTTVTVGIKYAIGMQAGSNWAQGFGVWIDYNQDDDFDDLDEFVYASPSASLNWFNDSIIISSFALPGVTRMRVRCQFQQTITAGESCTNFNWGETEDYNVLIQPNTSTPVANFMADTIFTCTGLIDFSDLSLFAPTSWTWDFGDGNFSSAQNPSHTYGADGTYSVSLLVSNSFGIDSIAFSNYITVSLSGPIPPSCTPVTFGHCCQMGIYNVTFEAINNNSTNGSVSYEDFSCGSVANVTMNSTYAISVETGPTFEENVEVWIDYNNDGVFSGGEQVFTSSQVVGVHTGFVTIPGNPVSYTGLRMRVGSDWWQNAAPSPCVDVQYGQFEDYSVIIQPDTIPPVADLIADATLTCSGTVNFTDLSSPAATSWLWDFGDGFTDTTQNPTHTYTIDGIYTVTLIATNQYGSDTVVFTNYIQVNVSGGGPILPSCTPASLNYCCGFGITQFSFNTISSTTLDGAAGYEDLTCSFGTNVVEGQTYNFFADMSSSAPGLHNIRAWIDHNNDGSFDNVSELVYADDNVATTSGTITIASGGVLNTALRMRVAADYDFEAAPLPCADLERGQAEDYAITVLANTNPPIAGFSAQSTISCDGIVSFIDESNMVPTYWLWDFGDGQTSNLQNPVYSYQADGDYTVTLIVANSNGSDTVEIVDYISVVLGTGPVPASCTPSTLQYCCGYGIYNVTLATIANSTGGGADGYEDFSCTQKAYLVAGQSYGLSVTTGVSNPQDTRAWIDFNNDGILDDLTERVFMEDDDFSPSATISIPLGAVQDTALRMRISSDYSGSAPTPCSDVWYAQVEDYSIVIGVPPISDFSSSDSTFCESTCVSFNDLSTNNPNSWLWNFPGASPSFSTDQNPVNICYANPGTYNVSLIATNNFGGNFNNITGMITVLSCPTPVADFSTSASTICIGECLNFTDITTNTPDTWAWYFPGADSTSSSVQNPTGICYSTPGTYDVTLVVSNANGTDSITKSGLVTVNLCVPTAGFTASTNSVCETACAGFTDQSTNNPTSWAWSFPGASPDTSNVQNPLGVCYSIPGTYDVTLVVSNLSGSDTIVMTDYMAVLACPIPVADFAPSDSEICSGDCITFTDLSQNVVNWIWSFENGTPSSSFISNPGTICFSGPPGYYNVRLIAINAIGSDTMNRSILIDSAVADIMVDDTLFQNLPATFNDNSVSAVDWYWNFGDGNSTGFQNPIYTYSNIGTYTVTLIITNDNGCVDTATKDIVVVKYIGMEKLHDISAMSIYPNPASSNIYIQFNLPPGESSWLEIENTLGELVYTDRDLSTGSNSIELNIAFLPTGIYYVNVGNSRGIAVNKFIRH